MSANYSFVGEVNRNNAMGAVADTMNQLNLDILKATMEMGGKQVVEKDGKAYALERLDDTEIKDLKDKVTTNHTFTVGTGASAFTVSCSLNANGNYYGSRTVGTTTIQYEFSPAASGTEYTGKTFIGAAFPAGGTGATTIDTTTAISAPVLSYSLTSVTNTSTAEAIFDILGINPGSDIDGELKGNNWKINIIANADGGVTFNVAYKNANTGEFMGMAVILDKNGACIGLSELKTYESLDKALAGQSAIVKVDGGGLLKSWGITNPEELQPGDLFLVQQKLQIIKDTVSTVHTTGKTQGDIMREATQKFAQG